MTTRLEQAMASLPLVAILRGVKPAEVASIGEALFTAGFRIVEVPLNSPQPYDSIEILRKSLPAETIVGAGTVIGIDAVNRVALAGGDLIVMPHADVSVIRAAKSQGMVCVPGVATPTDAFAAIAAGADGLKAFPAETLTPTIIKAWRAVLPGDVHILPVGGITPQSMAAYVTAGASGFGLGSALYKPGASAHDVGIQAVAFVAAWRALSNS